MIRHIVLCRFAEATPETEITAIWDELVALRDVVPGIVEMRFGRDVSVEGLARGATHAFTVDFESVAARDGYLEHPAHEAAGKRLVAALEGGLEGLVVVDFTYPTRPKNHSYSDLEFDPMTNDNEATSESVRTSKAQLLVGSAAV